MQLNFPFAPVPCASKASATKPATKRIERLVNQPEPAPIALTVAEQLHRGIKVGFPPHANAVRVTIGTKTIVILKADADTLQGAGVATAVEFGIVTNDAKGHPIRKNFAAATLGETAPLPIVNAGNSRGETLVLSLQ